MDCLKYVLPVQTCSFQNKVDFSVKHSAKQKWLRQDEFSGAFFVKKGNVLIY